MLSPLAQDDMSDRLKEDYNASATANADRFIPEIEKTLALYDAFDGVCGNGWLSGPQPEQRYRELAKLLADDRLLGEQPFYAMRKIHGCGARCSEW